MTGIVTRCLWRWRCLCCIWWVMWTSLISPRRMSQEWGSLSLLIMVFVKCEVADLHSSQLEVRLRTMPPRPKKCDFGDMEVICIDLITCWYASRLQWRNTPYGDTMNVLNGHKKTNFERDYIWVGANMQEKHEASSLKTSHTHTALFVFMILLVRPGVQEWFSICRIVEDLKKVSETLIKRGTDWISRNLRTRKVSGGRGGYEGVKGGNERSGRGGDSV